MSLEPGVRLGPYEIGSPLGAGGMGEVYRARDTRLDRTVAIKICAAQFNERFEREARAVAALNHPNICALYDIGPDFLVMELVEGPTLAERIAAGAVPLDEALVIARQIAEALEAAHEKGIVHRDLKPANVKLTSEGKVKVLDFGLAKAMESDNAADADPRSSPTLTISATRAGMILGTAAYMSPEQARGLAVDKRADIWAFGVVLYEMLTGRLMFAGDTISDRLAAVLKTDLDWTALPGSTPPAIHRLLRRCLERDRKKRLHDICDARLEIDEALSAPAHAAAATAPPQRPRRTLLPWAIAALLLGSTAWFGLRPWRAASPESNFEVLLLPPEKAVFTPLQVNAGGMAVSPDGRTLAFVATNEGGNALWVRRLDSLTARPLPGTANAYYPFWSPDNRFVGFFADSKLKKIEVAGGSPQVICDASASHGGTWNRQGVIVFTSGASQANRTLQRVPAAGRQPVQISKLDPANHEIGHVWPYFLPDGRHFLYLTRSDVGGKSAICAGSLDGNPGERIELMKAASNAIYAPMAGGGIWSGHAGWLLFLRETTLFAQRFDAAGLKLEGEAVPVSERVGSISSVLLANISVSESGVLVYGHEGSGTSRPVWMSRDGRPSPVNAPSGTYFMPRLSPDGTRLAVSLGDSRTGNTDIWQIDLRNDIPTRFTFDPAPDVFPVWSPDGKQIVFGSTREGAGKLYRKAANGTGNEEPIAPQSANGQAAYDWSRDGRYILFLAHVATTGPDLWVLELNERKARPFLQTQFIESQAQFSPDGRWVAYSSDESGRYEIYVRNFAGPAAKFQISNNGGAQARWRGDGKELYYVTSDGKIMAVTVKAGADTLEREAPRVLFESRALFGISGSGPQGYLYDVTRDGQRFLVIERGDGGAAQQLILVTNWQARLRK